MADTGQALREASDELLRDLEALGVLEEEKRTIPAGDPRIIDLSERIETIAGRVLQSSTRQRALTEAIQEQAEVDAGAVPDESIEEISRPISAILAEWREAERQAEAADPGSAAAREAEILVGRLRDEYRRAHEEATRKKQG